MDRTGYSAGMRVRKNRGNTRRSDRWSNRWSNRHPGFTLLEAIISTAMFFIMITLLFGAYEVFMKCFRASEAKDDVHRKFLRIGADFQREASRTDIDTVMSGNYAGKSWICFKSNLDGDDNPHYDEDGFPLWQKFVIYYAIRPADDSCSQSFSNTDDICPHKYIIRKDVGISAVISSDEDIVPYLTFTLTTSQASLEPCLISARPVADDILEMKGSKDQFAAYMGLKILRIQEASRVFGVGEKPLSDSSVSRYINEFVLCSMPKNKEP